MSNKLQIEYFLSQDEIDVKKFEPVISSLIIELLNYIKLGVLQDGLNELLRNEHRLRLHLNKINLKGDKKTQNAYTLGLLKSITWVVETRENQNQVELPTNIDKIRSNKHFNSLIEVICVSHSISHGELARKLGISPSALYNLIKRMEPYDLFDVEREGKYKLYYSTYKTQAVYDSLNKKLEYTRADMFDAFSIFITSLEHEIERRDTINPIHIYEKVYSDLPDDYCAYRGEFKTAIENLTKTMNKKIRKSSPTFKIPSSLFEINRETADNNCDDGINLTKYLKERSYGTR